MRTRIRMVQHPPHKRTRMSWHPTWTREVEGWTAFQVKKNLWRFDRTDDFDDVMQEARLLFHTLERKYPIVNEAAHFFALYKTSLSRMFVDKTRRKQRSIRDQEDSFEATAPEIVGAPNYGFFNVLLEEMPDELKTVLRALTTGRVRLKLDRTPPRRGLRIRETHNMSLRRQFELASKDPVGDLRTYLLNS